MNKRRVYAYEVRICKQSGKAKGLYAKHYAPVMRVIDSMRIVFYSSYVSVFLSDYEESGMEYTWRVWCE